MKTITTNNKLSVSKSTVAKFNNQDTLNHKTASIISNLALSTLLRSFRISMIMRPLQLSRISKQLFTNYQNKKILNL
jgi:hypothetical protein